MDAKLIFFVKEAWPTLLAQARQACDLLAKFLKSRTSPKKLLGYLATQCNAAKGTAELT